MIITEGPSRTTLLPRSTLASFSPIHIRFSWPWGGCRRSLSDYQESQEQGTCQGTQFQKEPPVRSRFGSGWGWGPHSGPDQNSAAGICPELHRQIETVVDLHGLHVLGGNELIDAVYERDLKPVHPDAGPALTPQVERISEGGCRKDDAPRHPVEKLCQEAGISLLDLLPCDKEPALVSASGFETPSVRRRPFRRHDDGFKTDGFNGEGQDEVQILFPRDLKRVAHGPVTLDGYREPIGTWGNVPEEEAAFLPGDSRPLALGS